MTKPLSGLRIIEFQGLGPGPFCGMHLADLGADVIVIERPDSLSASLHQAAVGIMRRGKRSIVLDLQDADDLDIAQKLVATADGMIEGYRPGVMERLGLGPEAMMALNPKLVYGRLTGWGQDGPMAAYAGHDINYAAITGALYYTGEAGQKPLPTPALTADVAGGAHYMMIGMLAALLKARTTGVGDVIDTAMIDGTAHMMNLILDIIPKGLMKADGRGQNLLDGPHWYNAYVTKDQRFITVGALEPKFYGELLQLLDLQDDPDFADQMNAVLWPAQATKLAAIFRRETQQYWREKLSDSNACFAPVLNLKEAIEHPQMKARGVYDLSAGFQQAMPAPRFASCPVTEVSPIPEPDDHRAEILQELAGVKGHSDG